MYYVLKNDEVKQNCLEYIKNISSDIVWGVEIKKHVKSRTHAQNRLYHMWVEIIANDTVGSHDELCEILKLRFLGTEKIQHLGYSIEVIKSTTKLNTQEFTDYLNKIEELALSLEIRLPHPEDIYREAMGE